MNRNQRRQSKRLNEKQTVVSPMQNRLVEKLALEKANVYIQHTAKIINQCYFKAMRSNRVGKERANRILDQTEILINVESRRKI